MIEKNSSDLEDGTQSTRVRDYRYDALPNITSDEELNDLIAAANSGDVETQVILGYMYSVGKYVELSEETGAKWYRMAAEQGDQEA